MGDEIKKSCEMERIPFSETTAETVEMTEIDGMEQGAVLQYMDITKGAHTHEEKEFRTCLGDLYVIVNALRDYANLLESVIPAWGLIGFHEAIYRFHAERCRKISRKYAEAVGYDYDAAVERCRKRRAKGSKGPDTGMDGLEAFVQKRRNKQIHKEKKDIANPTHL